LSTGSDTPSPRCSQELPRRAGAKAVHPHGVVHEARLLVDGARGAPLGSELFDTPAEWMAIMRFSDRSGSRVPFRISSASRYGP
jgi:hypothetical protein